MPRKHYKSSTRGLGAKKIRSLKRGGDTDKSRRVSGRAERIAILEDRLTNLTPGTGAYVLTKAELDSLKGLATNKGGQS